MNRTKYQTKGNHYRVTHHAILRFFQRCLDSNIQSAEELTPEQIIFGRKAINDSIDLIPYVENKFEATLSDWENAYVVIDKNVIITVLLKHPDEFQPEPEEMRKVYVPKRHKTTNGKRETVTKPKYYYK